MKSRLYNKIIITTACLCTMLFFLPMKVFAVPQWEGASGSHTKRRCISETSELVKFEDIPNSGKSPGSGNSGSGKIKAQQAYGETGTEKCIPLVLIVIGFENLSYNKDYDWGNHVFEESESLAQYYKDMSFNKFTFAPAAETSVYGNNGNTNKHDRENDGVIHVTLSGDKTKIKNYAWNWYDEGDPYTEPAETEMMSSLDEALVKADAYINFSIFDNNHNNLIENNELAIGFVVAGLDLAIVENPSQAYLYTWPHAFSFSGAKYYRSYFSGINIPKPDGKYVNKYIIMSEQYQKMGQERQEHHGTLAHELGHYLGLQDYYDAYPVAGDPWAYYKCGELSLMDAGCYGHDEYYNMTPFSLDIFSRVLLGWVKPQIVGTSDKNEDNVWSLGGSLDPSSGYPTAIRLNTSREGEYYLLENRRFTSWDRGMGGSSFYPAAKTTGGKDQGGGIIIWHIDHNIYDKYALDNMVNSSGHHPAVSVVYREQKDGKDTLIGTKMSTKNPFFSKDTWNTDLFLPLYGNKGDESDVPSDRIPALNLILSLDSNSAPVMQMHRHVITSVVPTISGDGTEMNCKGTCKHCSALIDLETTKVFASKVSLEPTATKAGKMQYTGSFIMDGLGKRMLEVEVPALAANEANALGQALLDITKKADPKDYQAGAYQAYKEIIDQAYALLESDKATAKELQDMKDKVEKAWANLDQNGRKISIENASIESIPDTDYTGKAIKPAPAVSLNGTALVGGKDYTLSYKNNKNAGKATVIVNGIGDYTGTKKTGFIIHKIKQTFTVKIRSPKVSCQKLKKHRKKVSKAVKIKGAHGKVTYVKVDGSKKLSVNKNTGTITVKKKTGRGTYKIRIRIKANGGKNYKAAKKTVTVTVRVR